MIRLVSGDMLMCKIVVSVEGRIMNDVEGLSCNPP